MNKRFFYHFAYTVIAIMLVTDINISKIYLGNEGMSNVQECGISAKHLKKGAQEGWSFFKKCSNHENIPKVSLPPKVPTNSILFLDEYFTKIENESNIIPQIEEYLSNNSPDQKVKTITCIRENADKVRMYFQQVGRPNYNKVIDAADEVIRLWEYDINSMAERTHKDNLGKEWIEFIIPHKAQYVLDNKYGDRLYECMIFNLPKDGNGLWIKIKALLVDFFTRPNQLWNEYQFRQELLSLEVNPNDVQEMKQYMFALKFKRNLITNKNDIYDEYIFET